MIENLGKSQFAKELNVKIGVLDTNDSVPYTCNFVFAVVLDQESSIFGISQANQDLIFSLRRYGTRLSFKMNNKLFSRFVRALDPYQAVLGVEITRDDLSVLDQLAFLARSFQFEERVGFNYTLQYRHCTAYNFFTIFDAIILFLLLCAKLSSVNTVLPALTIAEETLMYLTMCASFVQCTYRILPAFEKFKGVFAIAIAMLG